MSNKFTKDEYEMQLYMFTLQDFKEENFQFVNEQIEKTMQFMNKQFYEKLKEINAETKININEATNIVTKDIEESCKENIDKIVNTLIDDLLSIPENVILPNDEIKLKNQNGSEEKKKELEFECSELTKMLLENAMFISFLENEYNSYAIQDVLKKEDEIISKAEEYLNLSYDVNIYFENLKKVESFNE